MNRRQLLGASLAGIIAALCLPFERFAEWCERWLGAACDAFTDDTAWIQAAIDRAIESGEREVLLKGRRYRLTRQLSVPTSVTLVTHGGTVFEGPAALKVAS